MDTPQKWLLIEIHPRPPRPEDKILLSDGTVRALGLHGLTDQTIVIAEYSETDFLAMIDERVKAEMTRRDLIPRSAPEVLRLAPPPYNWK